MFLTRGKAVYEGRKSAFSRLGGASEFSGRFALDRWGLVPDRDVAIVQIIFLKPTRGLPLNTLKKYARLDDLSVMQRLYDEYSQRLIRPVPYPTTEGIQTIIDHLEGPEPNDFIDSSDLERNRR